MSLYTYRNGMCPTSKDTESNVVKMRAVDQCAANYNVDLHVKAELKTFLHIQISW